MTATIFKTLLRYGVLSVCALLAVEGEVLATDVMLPAFDDITPARHSSSPRIKQFGTTGEEQAYKSVLDKRGNLYVTGYTTGDLDGPGPEANVGGYDIYVMKLNPQGHVVWIRQFGSPEDDRAHFVALDSRGYVYVTGHTGGDLDGSGTEAHSGGEDAFLLKLDEYGHTQWLQQFGTSGYEMGLGLAIDAWDNPYVIGFTEGDIDGNGPGVNTGGYDIYLAVFDVAGNFRWTRQIGSPSEDVAYAVTIDAHGNIYATGYSYGNLGDYGTHVNAGESDLVVLKFDIHGELQWIRQLGTPSDDYGYALAVESRYQRLYITGFFSGDLDGDGSGAHAGGTDLAVIKMSRNGSLLWSRQFGATGNDWGHGVTVDRSGSVYVTGAISGDLDGPGPLIYHGKRDVIVVKLYGYGATQWIRQWGTAGQDFGLDIMFDRKNRVYITGQTQGDLDGPGPQTHVGDFDSFVLNFAQPKKKLWW